MDFFVDVPSAELPSALRMLDRTTDASARGEAVLRYEAGELILECGGAAVAVQGEGTWVGHVRVSSSSLLRLRQGLPEGPGVRVGVEDGRLRVGRMALPCAWEETTEELISLPINPGFLELLAVGRRYSRERIRASGIQSLVEEAEGRRDQLIQSASAILEPRGIAAAELEAIVNARLDQGVPGKGGGG